MCAHGFVHWKETGPIRVYKHFTNSINIDRNKPMLQKDRYNSYKKTLWVLALL